MNSKIVFTNGCFDVIHRGHVELLRHCRLLAGPLGKVIVAINSDTSIKNLKGDNRPVYDQNDRRTILQSIKYVDQVIVFNEDTPEKLLSMIEPDIIVKGGDYTVQQVIGKQYAKSVVIFPYVSGYSTTSTIEKIQNSCFR